MSEILSLEIGNNDATAHRSRIIGQFGEELAAQYLIRKGYRLVMANYKVPIGRNLRGAQVTGEIDIIALENKTLCFIEVKTRTSDEFASPLSAVDVRKQRQITRTARIYRRIFNLQRHSFRYDVVGIILGTQAEPQITLSKNFWHESKFKKKIWNDELW